VIVEVSQRSWPVHLEVERGKIAQFARATGLADFDPETAPPTFTAVLNHWGLSVSDVMRDLGYDMLHVVHGEETISYPNGPLRAGDILDGEVRIVGVDHKEGRSGPIEIVHMQIVFERPGGQVAVVIDRDLVSLGGVRGGS
jgi:hypothetical protein